MTDIAPNTQPVTSHRTSIVKQVRDRAYKLTVVLLLVVVTLTSLGTFLSTRAASAQDREMACTSLEYDFAEDEDGSTDYDTTEKVRFSDLDAEERAQADLLECDIEGR